MACSPRSPACSDEPDRFRRIWLENLQRLALLSDPRRDRRGARRRATRRRASRRGVAAAIVPLQILALKGVVGTFSATSGEVFQALHRPKLRVLSECTLPRASSCPRSSSEHAGRASTARRPPRLIVNARVRGRPARRDDARCSTFRPTSSLTPSLRPAVGWVLLTVSLSCVLRPLVDDLPAGAQLVILVAVGASVYAAERRARSRGARRRRCGSACGARELRLSGLARRRSRARPVRASPADLQPEAARELARRASGRG